MHWLCFFFTFAKKYDIQIFGSKCFWMWIWSVLNDFYDAGILSKQSTVYAEESLWLLEILLTFDELWDRT